MTYDTFSESHPAESRLRDFLGRHAWRLGGLALMALAAAMLASLITWRVDDPSFSYAIDGPAENILGRPGAAFADLAMQFFGFAVVGVVFPLVLCGWNLLRLRLPRRPIRQLAAWLGGALLLATAFSCLPTLEKWPLPTGLGGASGDLVLGVVEWFGGGELSGGLYAGSVRRSRRSFARPRSGRPASRGRRGCAHCALAAPSAGRGRKMTRRIPRKATRAASSSWPASSRIGR